MKKYIPLIFLPFILLANEVENEAELTKAHDFLEISKSNICLILKHLLILQLKFA